MSHEDKNRADKFRIDNLAKDKEGLAPRLNELIRYARLGFWLLLTIAMILGATFLLLVVQGIIGR
jgi:hypothetical protein